jgi:undecaprenyl-diphosphatase
VAALLLAEGIVNVVLKPAIRRERPFVRGGLPALLVQAPGPNSWPSAHAASSVAAAGVLAYVYHAAAPAFLVAALLIAYSRIYVGVHYPLDVLAGVVIGFLCAAIVIAASTVIAPPFHIRL